VASKPEYSTVLYVLYSPFRVEQINDELFSDELYYPVPSNLMMNFSDELPSNLKHEYSKYPKNVKGR